MTYEQEWKRANVRTIRKVSGQALKGSDKYKQIQKVIGGRTDKQLEALDVNQLGRITKTVTTLGAKDYGNMAQSKRESKLYRVGRKLYRSSNEEFIKEKAKEESQYFTKKAQEVQQRQLRVLEQAGQTAFKSNQPKMVKEKIEPKQTSKYENQPLIAPQRKKEASETIDVKPKVEQVDLGIQQTRTLDKAENVFKTPDDPYSKTISKIRKKAEVYEIEGIREGGLIGRYKQSAGALVSSAYYPIRTPEAVSNLAKAGATGFVIGAGATLLNIATGGLATPVLSYAGGIYASTKVPEYQKAFSDQQNPVQQREFIAQGGAELVASIGGGYAGSSAVIKGQKLYIDYKEDAFKKSLNPKKGEGFKWGQDYTTQRELKPYEKTLLESKAISQEQKDIILQRAGGRRQTGVKILGSKDTQLQLQPKTKVIETAPKQQPLKVNYYKDFYDTKSYGVREYLGKYTQIPRTEGTGYPLSRNFPSKSTQYELISPATKEPFPFTKTQNPLSSSEIAKIKAYPTAGDKISKTASKVMKSKIMVSKKAELSTSQEIVKPNTIYEKSKSLLDNLKIGSNVKKQSIDISRSPPKVLEKLYTPIVSIPKSKEILDQYPVVSIDTSPVVKPQNIPKTVEEQITPIQVQIVPELIPETTNAPKYRSVYVQEPIQENKQIPKQEETYTPLVKIPTYSPPVTAKIIDPFIPPTPSLPKKPENNIQKAGGEFSLLVRRRGKFQEVGIFDTIGEAFAKGKTVVGTTAGASFKVERDNQVVNRRLGLLDQSQFYKSKKEEGVFIERREKRISTAGEKEEITYKGLAILGINRNKKRKGGFSIF